MESSTNRENIHDFPNSISEIIRKELKRGFSMVDRILLRFAVSLREERNSNIRQNLCRSFLSNGIKTGLRTVGVKSIRQVESSGLRDQLLIALICNDECDKLLGSRSAAPCARLWNARTRERQLRRVGVEKEGNNGTMVIFFDQLFFTRSRKLIIALAIIAVEKWI